MAEFLELAVGLIVLILLLFFVFRDITVGKKKYEPSVEPIGQRLEIAGKAFVIDGDTIKVSGERVRIAGIDAPELGQLARYPYRNWYDQGESVKIKLIKKIGGKYIRVERKKYDKYNRVVGAVYFLGEDIGKWMVWNGYAIAAYGDQYESVESKARSARRGMWGHAEVFDPKYWRHKGDLSFEGLPRLVGD